MLLLLSAAWSESFFLQHNGLALLNRAFRWGASILPIQISELDVDEAKDLSVWRPFNALPLSTLSKDRIGEVLETVPDEILKLRAEKAAAIDEVGLLWGGHPLPETHISAAGFFGREEEVARLNALLQNETVSLAEIVAPGGVGKTSLVTQWLNHLRQAGYSGISRVFTWSFYSQGSDAKRQTSADYFIDAMLKWLGVELSLGTGPYEKGERLAMAIAEQPTLLLLDGIEPLQHPLDSPAALRGSLKDPGLKALLQNLALQPKQGGITLLTTRLPIADLNSYNGQQSRRIDLTTLSVESGKALLKYMGVEGEDAEFEKAIQEYQGHALALSLLGRYLRKYRQGDIRQRDTISLISQRKDGERLRVRNVLAAYESGFSDRPELIQLLSLLSLFDGPMTVEELSVLVTEHRIKGLSDAVPVIKSAKRVVAIEKLEGYHLITVQNDKGLGWASIDMHPLVREYFREQLRENKPEAYQEAHTRLYHYYKDLPSSYFQETLQGLEPFIPGHIPWMPSRLIPRSV